MNEFKEYCQQLFENWLKGNVTFNAAMLASFQADYCPEPYLVIRGVFGRGTTAFFLTNNPGAGMDMQLRSNILNGESLIRPDVSYEENATNLSQFYLNNLTGTPQKRIEKMLRMADVMRIENVVQIEAFPFHSASFSTPDKAQVVQESQIMGSPVHVYTTLLRNLMRLESAIALSVHSDNWQHFQASLIGLEIQSADRHITNLSSNGTESGIFLHQLVNGKHKGLISVQGSYTIPGGAGFNLILDVLRGKAITKESTTLNTIVKEVKPKDEKPSNYNITTNADAIRFIKSELKKDLDAKGWNFQLRPLDLDRESVIWVQAKDVTARQVSPKSCQLIEGGKKHLPGATFRLGNVKERLQEARNRLNNYGCACDLN